MTRVSSVKLMEQPQTYYLCIRKTINFMKEYAVFAEEVFSRIQAYLSELAVLPADGPVVCFHNQELEKLDVSIGFPLAKKVADAGTISCIVLTPQKVISAIDLGSYEESDGTLMEMFNWIKDHAYEASGPIYYHYLNGPDEPQEYLLTKMVLPLHAMT